MWWIASCTLMPFTEEEDRLCLQQGDSSMLFNYFLNLHLSNLFSVAILLHLVTAWVECINHSIRDEVRSLKKSRFLVLL